MLKCVPELKRWSTDVLHSIIVYRPIGLPPDVPSFEHKCGCSLFQKLFTDISLMFSLLKMLAFQRSCNDHNNQYTILSQHNNDRKATRKDFIITVIKIKI